MLSLSICILPAALPGQPVNRRAVNRAELLPCVSLVALHADQQALAGFGKILHGRCPVGLGFLKLHVARGDFCQQNVRFLADFRGKSRLREKGLTFFDLLC